MKLSVHAALFCAASILSACGPTNPAPKQNGKPGGADASGDQPLKGFLTPADIKMPAHLTAVSEADLHAQLDDHPQSGSTSTSTSTSDDSGDCTGKAFDGTPVRAKGSRLLAEINTDLASCYNRTKVDGGPTFTNATIHGLVAMECEGEDVSAYDGKPWPKTAEIFCKGSYKVIENITMDLAFTDAQGAAAKFHSIYGEMALDGGPCVYTRQGGISTVKDCLNFAIDDGSYRLTTVKTLIKGPNGAATGGDVVFQLGGWNGVVKFSTTAGAKPTWTATSGADTQTGALGDGALGLP